MNKMVAFFVGLFMVLSLLCGILDGVMSLSATTLTADETATDTTINVTSTEGFYPAGVLIIGSEKIAYTGSTAVTFTGCVRGYEETIAEAYGSGSTVYEENSGIINQALNFDIARVASTSGWLAFVTVPVNFVTRTTPKLISWDYSLFETSIFFDGDLALLRYVLMGISIGFYIAFAIQALQVAAGIFTR